MGIRLGGNAGTVSGDPTTAIGLNSMIPRTAPGYKRNGKNNNERSDTNVLNFARSLDSGDLSSR